MLIFGTIEFGTMTIHGNTTEIAVVQSIHKRYDHALEYLNKQVFIDENDGFDYVDTEEYAGTVVFSKEALDKSIPTHGINEASKTIAILWELSEVQEHLEHEYIDDDVLWRLMQTEYHKTGAFDIENLKYRVWDYQARHPKSA